MLSAPDDTEMQAWVSEIHLRACIRIGELSRELETAQGARTDTSARAGEEVTKAAALAEAGISTSTAHRYEELAGGRDEQAQEAAAAAVEHYMVGAKAAGVARAMPTMPVSCRAWPPCHLGAC